MARIVFQRRESRKKHLVELFDRLSVLDVAYYSIDCVGGNDSHASAARTEKRKTRNQSVVQGEAWICPPDAQRQERPGSTELEHSITLLLCRPLPEASSRRCPTKGLR